MIYVSSVFYLFFHVLYVFVLSYFNGEGYFVFFLSWWRPHCCPICVVIVYLACRVVLLCFCCVVRSCVFVACYTVYLSCFCHVGVVLFVMFVMVLMVGVQMVDVLMFLFHYVVLFTFWVSHQPAAPTPSTSAQHQSLAPALGTSA